MEIPLDIVDHMFSFLISDLDSLIRCSEAHPIFSPIFEKYQYYHIVIRTNDRSSYFTKLLSNKPQIAAYVRVLQVELYRELNTTMLPLSEELATILPRLQALECLVLSSSLKKVSWQEDIPQMFRKSLEDCLRLPTLQEVHTCCWDFPISTLDNHPNIQYLAFSGTPQSYKLADTTYPHLKYLSVENFYHELDEDTIPSVWAIKHSTKLHSLKYDYSSNETILELLENCSDTLNNLDLTLTGSELAEFATIYGFKKRRHRLRGHNPTSIDLSSLPRLQHLTIRAAIYFNRKDTKNEMLVSFLPAGMGLLKTASSLQQLTIEIVVDLSSGYIDCDDFRTIDDIDFSPLTALAQSPGSFPRMDLHFNPDDWDFTHTQIVSLLSRQGLTELIDQGVLVVHLDAAPIFLDTVSKRTLVEDQRSIVLPFAYHPNYWY